MTPRLSFTLIIIKWTRNSKDEPLAIGGFTSVERYIVIAIPEELSENINILGGSGNVWIYNS
jgi:hypothetical protein